MTNNCVKNGGGIRQKRKNFKKFFNIFIKNIIGVPIFYIRCIFSELNVSFCPCGVKIADILGDTGSISALAIGECSYFSAFSALNPIYWTANYPILLVRIQSNFQCHLYNHKRISYQHLFLRFFGRNWKFAAINIS